MTFSPVSTGYASPSLDPSLGTAPPSTGYAQAASTGGGALPNAGVPTSFDPRSMMVDSVGNYIQPPVTDMGNVGPISTALATPTSGWNADYGNAFARAFMQAGVSPSVTSAALHTLAAGQPTTQELDQALQYLSSPQGANLAPYLAENLAEQAPSYAQIGADGDTASSMPYDGSTDQYGSAGDPVAYPPTDQQYADPGMMPGGTAYPSGTDDTSAAGTAVGTDADGNPITVTGQDQDGNYVLSDGSVIDPQGNMVQGPGGTDPTTGQSPDAAQSTDAQQSDDGGGGLLPKLLLGATGMGGLLSVVDRVRHGKGHWNPLNAFRNPAVPTTPGPVGGTGGASGTVTDPKPGGTGGGGSDPSAPHTDGTRSTRPLYVTDDEAGLKKQYDTLMADRKHALDKVAEFESQPYSQRRNDAIGRWQAKATQAERSAERLITNASPDKYAARITAAKDKLADMQEAYEATRAHPDVKGPSLLDVNAQKRLVAKMEGVMQAADKEAAQNAAAHAPRPRLRIQEHLPAPGRLGVPHVDASPVADAVKGAVTHAIDEQVAHAGQQAIVHGAEAAAKKA